MSIMSCSFAFHYRNELKKMNQQSELASYASPMRRETTYFFSSSSSSKKKNFFYVKNRSNLEIVFDCACKAKIETRTKVKEYHHITVKEKFQLWRDSLSANRYK